jgi:hypothetical protein
MESVSHPCPTQLTIEANRYRFCEYIKKRPEEMYNQIKKNVLHSFFHWILSQKRTEKGNRKRRIKYKSTLGTYWKIFRLVYTGETGRRLDDTLNREMHKV